MYGRHASTSPYSLEVVLASEQMLISLSQEHREWLTKTPFHHESLLMDCKGSRLTKAEKRAAQKGYELEKRASSSFNYSRQSYASFYAAAGYPDKNCSNGLPTRKYGTVHFVKKSLLQSLSLILFQHFCNKSTSRQRETCSINTVSNAERKSFCCE